MRTFLTILGLDPNLYNHVNKERRQIPAQHPHRLHSVQFTDHYHHQPHRSRQTETAVCSHELSPIPSRRYVSIHFIGFRDLYQCGCASFRLADTFKGLSVMIPQVVINNFMFMQLYEFQRKRYSLHMSSTYATALSSIVSRIIVTTVLIPAEALRVRISNSTHDRKIQGHQKGLSITLTRDLIYSSLFWTTTEELRNYFVGAEYRHKAGIDYEANMAAGAIAGGLIACITTPFDTLKTRIQSGMKL